MSKTFFREVSQLKGENTFKELEKNWDESIFYADGNSENVLWHTEKEFLAGPFRYYFFDGMYIALINL